MYHDVYVCCWPLAQLELDDPTGHRKLPRYRELLRDDPDGRARKAFEGALPESEAVWSAGQVMTLIDDVPSCAELWCVVATTRVGGYRLIA